MLHNAAVTLVILFSLKTMECLENGLQPQPGATPLYSMRAVSLMSWQHCRSIDAVNGPYSNSITSSCSWRTRSLSYYQCCGGSRSFTRDLLGDGAVIWFTPDNNR